MKYHVPQHLDEPFRIILWTIDEIGIFLLPFLTLMFIFNSPITGFVMGGLCMMGLRKIKGENGHMIIYNLMYWYLPALNQFKAFPPSYKREWLG